MTENLKILLIEDDEDDYVLTHDLLSEVLAGALSLDWAASWEAAFELMDAYEYDVGLVDYHLGERTGLELLSEAEERGFNMPFIMLTGQDSTETDRKASAAGAADYLVKGSLTGPLLERAIRYAQERKRSELQLEQLAQRDPLTGLANRAFFLPRLADVINQAKRSSQVAAVLFIDVDHFKWINDTHGHAVGDALLIEISHRLAACTRETDTVSRLGGDEFAIIATNLTSTDGANILAHKIVESLAKPFNVGGHTIQSGASIGIALFPHDGEGATELLHNADIALYQTKKQGRGAYRFFDAEMSVRAQMRTDLESDIRRGPNAKFLKLHYQPILDPHDWSIIGCEALLRWNHPADDPLMPDHIISIAENGGLITSLGEHVLTAACPQTVVWQQTGLPPLPISINISALQLKTGALSEAVERILATTGATPSQLEFEVSESAIFEDIDSAIPELNRLREIGIKLVLDSFGMGRSSLASLKQLPFTKLKIDNSFLADIVRGSEGDSIFKAIITLGNALGMEVIAKGVETEAQCQFLSRENCRGMQGFYFCRPLPADLFVAWRKKNAHQRRVSYA